MKTFDEKLQAELDKLPFERGVDDSLYKDGVIDGFDLGARWAATQAKGGEPTPSTHSEVGEIVEILDSELFIVDSKAEHIANRILNELNLTPTKPVVTEGKSLATQYREIREDGGN